MRNRGNRLVSIYFTRAELLYDIANCSWIGGDALETENTHLKRIVQDICDEGNINRITQMLDLAYCEVVEMLYPYCKQSVEPQRCGLATTPEDNDLTYIIQLALPEGFSATTVHLLEKLAREYIICRVLSDWISMTYPEGRVIWIEKAEDIKGKMQRCKNSRRKPVRRRLYPF